MAKTLEEKRRIAAEASRRWRAANPERAKQIERDAYHRRLAKAGKQSRERRAKTEEEKREAIRSKAKRWREENRDRHNELRRRQYLRHRERRLHKVRLRTYGLTDEQLAALGTSCGICRATSSGRFDKKTGREYPMHIDHCHVTNKVRGMLCVRCNVGLGYFFHDIARLEQAIDYLKRTA